MPQNDIVKPKLRRSIYIGLGGTGTDAIKIVKEYFLTTCGHVPSMIKFLAIDTNQAELGKKGFANNEQMAIVLSRPKPIYENAPKMYSWIPEKNIENIQGIGNRGAGQVRSNGAFALAVKENSGSEDNLTNKLIKLRNNLVNVTSDDADYDLQPSTVIDVHLCFSICGGTGSGMFLEVAKIIKKVIQNSNLIGYAVSNSFYDNVGVHWNVKSNAYASMLELDYCMHAHRREYEYSVYEPVNEKPFDALMYIDNKTYTRNETEEEYSYEREQVLSNIGYAMILSAGNLGDDANSIVDNLKGATLSGGYDIDCKNGKKSAWVSSLGVSELFCRSNSSQDLFSHKLAIQELTNLKDGNPTNAATTAKQWIAEFKINEGGPEDPNDHDELIDRMIAPNLYQYINTANSIKVDDSGTVNDSAFLTNAPVKFQTLDNHLNTFIEGIIDKLNSHVMELIFPSQGNQTCGLSYLQSVLTTFNQSIAGYRKCLEDEITEYEIKISDGETKEGNSVKALQAQANARWKNQNTITLHKNAIRNIRLQRYKLECEVERRKMAIKVYSSLEIKIISDYLHEIARLRTVLDSVVNALNSEVGKFEIPEKADKRSTSVDVTSEIAQLRESQVTDEKFEDWSDFYHKTKKVTLRELADKSDWKQFVLAYVKDKYPIKSAQPIVKIMKRFDEKGILGSRLKDVLNRARPLMDVSSYGNIRLRPTEFVIVSLPNADGDETRFIRDAFDNEYQGPNEIQYVSIKDSNRIIVYKQLGVIPPYYIKGMSSGKNTDFDSLSCEDAYNCLRNSEDNYSPFTKRSYEMAVRKGGHTLDTFLGAISETDCFEMWVNGFILGLITRDSDKNYRFISKEGELDLDDLESYINLGASRMDAYKKFENLKDTVKREFSQRQTEMLSEPATRIQYDQFFEGSRSSLLKYKDDLSLIEDANEYRDQRPIMEKELNYIKSKFI